MAAQAGRSGHRRGTGFGGLCPCWSPAATVKSATHSALSNDTDVLSSTPGAQKSDASLTGRTRGAGRAGPPGGSLSACSGFRGSRSLLMAPPSQAEGRAEPLWLWGPSASAARLRRAGQWTTQVPLPAFNHQLHLPPEPLSPSVKIGSRVRTWNGVDRGDTFGSVPPAAALGSGSKLSGATC